MNRLGKKIIFVVYILILIILAEFLVARFAPQKTYTKARSDNNNCFIKSDFAAFELKPLCQMNFRNFDTNNTFITHINNIGNRGENYDISKNQNKKKIIVVGDSFILGFGVEDKNLLTSYLNTNLTNNKNAGILNNSYIINAGYAGGFGPDGYYLYLKNKGIKFEPDLVVFSVFVYNDFSDIENSIWYGSGNFGQPKRVESKTIEVDEGYLVNKDSPLTYRIPVIRDSHLAILLSNFVSASAEKGKSVIDRIRFKLFPPQTASGEASDLNILGAHERTCIYGEECQRQVMHLYNDLLSVTKAANILVNNNFTDGKPHFVVLLIPADFQIYPDSREKYRIDVGIPYSIEKEENPNPQKRLKEMFAKEGIPYIDLLNDMRKSKDRLYYLEDGHWNSQGHKVASESVLKWIEENY